MTTEESNLEKRVGNDTTVAKFSPYMYAQLRKRGLISDDEKQWAGYGANYRGSEHNEQNPDHVTYDNMPAEYSEDNNN